MDRDQFATKESIFRESEKLTLLQSDSLYFHREVKEDSFPDSRKDGIENICKIAKIWHNSCANWKGSQVGTSVSETGFFIRSVNNCHPLLSGLMASYEDTIITQIDIARVFGGIEGISPLKYLEGCLVRWT